MSRPVFVIGMSRNGTTVTDRFVRLSPDVRDQRYAPFDRWDFAAITELGGMLPRAQQIMRVASWLEAGNGLWAAVKFSLPWSYEAFGWPKLMDRFPEARFVLILRHPYPAWQSWSDMPHVQAIGVSVAPEVYRVWHDRMAATFSQFAALHADRCCLLSYENLVRGASGTMAPVWAMLTVRAPDNLQSYIKLPKHRLPGNGVPP